MAIKPHNGFMSQKLGLTSAVILTILSDRITKKDSDPVTLGEIAAATLASAEDIQAAMQRMIDEKLIKIDGGELVGAGSFQLKGFQFVLSADQRTMPLTPEEAGTASPTTKREETGVDEIDLGGCRYFGTVEFCGDDPAGPYFQLVIKRQTIGSKIDDIDTVFEDQLPDRERAWVVFDNFVQKDSREKTGDQIYLALGGTEWTMEVRAKADPFSPDVPKKNSQLTIYRQASDEATSAKVVEEAFESDTEAWTYVDEYLGPIETELAAEVEEAEAS